MHAKNKKQDSVYEPTVFEPPEKPKPKEKSKPKKKKKEDTDEEEEYSEPKAPKDHTPKGKTNYGKRVKQISDALGERKPNSAAKRKLKAKAPVATEEEEETDQTPTSQYGATAEPTRYSNVDARAKKLLGNDSTFNY